MIERDSENHFLREEVKQLAGIQNEIISLFDAKPIGLDYHLNPFHFHKSSNALGISHEETHLEGLGTSSILFVHHYDDRERHNRYYEGRLRITSDRYLRLGLHTDEATREQMESLYRENKTSYIGTYYFFNNHGDYTKTVLLPSQIIDSRPGLTNSSVGKCVEGDIQSSEVELIGFVLYKLLNKTQATLEELNS